MRISLDGIGRGLAYVARKIGLMGDRRVIPINNNEGNAVIIPLSEVVAPAPTRRELNPQRIVIQAAAAAAAGGMEVEPDRGLFSESSIREELAKSPFREAIEESIDANDYVRCSQLVLNDSSALSNDTKSRILFHCASKLIEKGEYKLAGTFATKIPDITLRTEMVVRVQSCCKPGEDDLYLVGMLKQERISTKNSRQTDDSDEDVDTREPAEAYEDIDAALAMPAPVVVKKEIPNPLNKPTMKAALGPKILPRIEAYLREEKYEECVNFISAQRSLPPAVKDDVIYYCGLKLLSKGERDAANKACLLIHNTAAKRKLFEEILLAEPPMRRDSDMDYASALYSPGMH